MPTPCSGAGHDFGGPSGSHAWGWAQKNFRKILILVIFSGIYPEKRGTSKSSTNPSMLRCLRSFFPNFEIWIQGSVDKSKYLKKNIWYDSRFKMLGGYSIRSAIVHRTLYLKIGFTRGRQDYSSSSTMQPRCNSRSSRKVYSMWTSGTTRS